MHKFGLFYLQNNLKETKKKKKKQFHKKAINGKLHTFFFIYLILSLICNFLFYGNSEFQRFLIVKIEIKDQKKDKEEVVIDWQIDRNGNRKQAKRGESEAKQ